MFRHVGGAHEHLQAALQELTQRNQQIEADLARLEVLHVEKESIRASVQGSINFWRIA